MTEPPITIVIPVHNREGIVRRTLASVQAQTYRPLRVVLVDNASTDGTLPVLRAWSRQVEGDIGVEVVECAIPGAASARNAGLARVTTPWVMFFDSDDTMEPGHVARAAEAIGRYRQARIIGWDVTAHPLAGRSRRLGFSTRRPLYDCVQHGTLSTQRYICRTSLVRNAGGWDSTARVWDDIELGTRLLALVDSPSGIVRLGGAPTVHVHESEVSITGASYHGNAQAHEHTLRLIAATLAPDQQYVVNLKRAILAALYRREGHRADALRLRAEALAATPGRWHRALLRAAYAHTAMGLPGAARLLYHLFKIKP